MSAQLETLRLLDDSENNPHPSRKQQFSVIHMLRVLLPPTAGYGRAATPAVHFTPSPTDILRTVKPASRPY